ncbi:hypothetical protein H0X10_02860 [Candidatus Saccharibacteria bacterium]|nr:hypothetical protein [Candidatus Saccharibacteria bacterium]
MNIIKKLSIAMSAFGLLFAFAVVPSISAQTPRDSVCEGVVIATGQGCDGPGAETAVNKTIRLVVNTLSLIVGVVAVIMIIIGGLKYITSSGDSNNVSSAKNTILYAVIGLVIVALAQVIVRFVLDKTSV